MSSQTRDTRFTDQIPYSQDWDQELVAMCHSPDTLRSHGYDSVADPHNRIENKLRCIKCLVNLAKLGITRASATSQAASSDRTTKICFFHHGKIVKGKWPCCGGGKMSKGCIGSYKHTIPPEDDPTLQEYWRYYTTPGQVLVPSQRQQYLEGQKEEAEMVPFRRPPQPIPKSRRH